MLLKSDKLVFEIDEKLPHNFRKKMVKIIKQYILFTICLFLMLPIHCNNEKKQSQPDVAYLARIQEC